MQTFPATISRVYVASLDLCSKPLKTVFKTVKKVFKTVKIVDLTLGGFSGDIPNYLKSYANIDYIQHFETGFDWVD